MSAGLLAMMVENWQSNSRDWVTMQVKGSLGVLERKTEFISSTLSPPPLLWKSRSCHSTQKGSAVLTLATQGYLSFGEQPESGLRGVTSYMKRSTPDWQPILRSVLSLLDSEGTEQENRKESGLTLCSDIILPPCQCGPNWWGKYI